MLTTLLSGAAIALAFSAPPGPVALETIRRGLRSGFGPALRVQLGSIIGDLTWCLAALAGLAPLVQVAWIRMALGVIGVGVLIYLGGLGIRDAVKPPAPSTAAALEHKGAFRSGLWISMANPMAVGYWLGVGGTLVAAGVVGESLPQTTAFVAGFVTAVFLWAFVMALAVRFGRQWMTPALFRLVTFACGLTLIVFGLSLASELLVNGLNG
jgi:chemosensory pili system protein ChpE